MITAIEYPNIYRVTMAHNGQILWKHRDNFGEWCEDMKTLGYDVCYVDMFERYQHDPRTTIVYRYPNWILTKQEVVA